MKLRKKIRETRKKARAISPVLAILLMIVITVAASLVTYAWVMGYLSFTTAKAGRAMQVQSVAWDNDTQVLTVYVQNVGEDFVTLQPDSSVYVDGYLKTDVEITGTTDGALPAGDTAPIYIQNVTMGLGQRVRVRIVDLSGTFTEIHTVPLGGAGGVIPFVVIPTVTRELATEASFSGVVAGDLLVVIANTRTGSYTTGALTASATGYTTIQVASFYQTVNDRRAVAILYRVADGTESGTAPTVTWGGSGVSTYEILYQVFSGDGTDTWTPIANGANHGTEPEVNSLTVPSAALPGGSTANVLSIGAMVWRDDPGTPSFTSLEGLVEFDSGGAYSATEYNYGLPVTSTGVTWPTIQRASGLLVQIACE